MSDVTFELRRNGRILYGEDQTSNASGKFGWKGLTPGFYQVVEKKVSDPAYSENEGKVVASFRVDQNNEIQDKKIHFPNGSSNTDIVNQPNEGKLIGIEFTKINAKTNNPLKGAEFVLEYRKPGSSIFRELAGSKRKSDDRGKLIWNDLEAGDYRVIETKAPDGEKYDTELNLGEKATFTIAKNDENYYEIQNLNPEGFIIKNTEKPEEPTIKTGDFEFTKTDKDTKETLEGVEFTLTSDTPVGEDDNKFDYKVSKTTDENGKIKFEKLYPGTYTLEETKQLPGYKVNKETWKVVVDKEGNVKTQIAGGSDNELKISGNDTGFRYEHVASIKETLEPTDQPDVLKYTMVITSKSKLDHIKFFGDSAKFGGVPFNNYKRLGSYTPGQEITFTYNIKIKNIDGLSKNKKIFPISGFELRDEIGNERSTNSKPYFMISDNSDSGTLTITNEKEKPEPANLTIRKYDKDTNLGLEGAKFRIYKTEADAIADNAYLQEVESNEHGYAVFDSPEIQPNTTYYVKEIAAPDGYKITSAITAVTSSAKEDNTINAEIPNDKNNTRIELYKKDSEGNYLEGAKFRLLDENQNQFVPDRVETTDSNGYIEFDNLEPGKTYYLEEVEAPKGYKKKDGKLEFHVDEDGNISWKNSPLVEQEYTPDDKPVEEKPLEEWTAYEEHGLSSDLSKLNTSEYAELIDPATGEVHYYVMLKARDYQGAGTNFATNFYTSTINADIKKVELFEANFDRYGTLKRQIARDMENGTIANNQSLFLANAPNNNAGNITMTPDKQSAQVTNSLTFTDPMDEVKIFFPYNHAKKMSRFDGNWAYVVKVTANVKDRNKSTRVQFEWSNASGQGEYISNYQEMPPLKGKGVDSPIDDKVEKPLGPWKSDQATYTNPSRDAYPSYMNTLDYAEYNPETKEVTHYIMLKPDADNGGKTDRATTLNLSSTNAKIKSVSLYDGGSGTTKASYRNAMQKLNISLPTNTANAQNNNRNISIKMGTTSTNGNVRSSMTGLSTNSAYIKFPYDSNKKVGRFDADWGMLVKVVASVENPRKQSTMSFNWTTDEAGQLSTSSSQTIPALIKVETTPGKTIKESPVFTVINEKNPSVEFEKQDAASKKTLEGAEFALYKVSGNVESVVENSLTSSGSDGKFGFDNLENGSYKVYETASPEGYPYLGEKILVAEFTVENDKVTNLKTNHEFTETTIDNFDANEAYPIYNKVNEIKFKKVNKSGEPLQGAEFRLDRLLDEPVNGSDRETVLEKITSDAEGLLSLSATKPGRYQLIETQAPEGYYVTKTGQVAAEFTVERGTLTIKNVSVGDKYVQILTEDTQILDIVNKKKAEGKFQVNKVKNDGTTTSPLEGARFLLRDMESGQFVKIDGTFTTRSGAALTEGSTVDYKDLPVGEYELREFESPDGFIRTINTWKIVVDEDGKTTITAKDELDNDVEATINNPTDDSQASLTLENKANEIEFTKVDSKTDNPLTGAEFEIWWDQQGNRNEDGVIYKKYVKIKNLAKVDDAKDEYTFTTDSNGKFKLSNLKTGHYKIYETKIPEGYKVTDELRDNEPIPGANGKFVNEFFVDIDGDIKKNEHGVVDEDGENLITTIKNTPITGKIKVKKVDEDDNTLVIKGAEFTLYDENKETVINTATTGEDGIAIFEDLKPGTYYIKETTTPEGYQNPNKIWKVEIVDDKTVKVTPEIVEGETDPDNPGGGTGPVEPTEPEESKIDYFYTNPEYLSTVIWSGSSNTYLGSMDTWLENTTTDGEYLLIVDFERGLNYSSSINLSVQFNTDKFDIVPISQGTMYDGNTFIVKGFNPYYGYGTETYEFKVKPKYKLAGQSETPIIDITASNSTIYNINRPKYPELTAYKKYNSYNTRYNTNLNKPNDVVLATNDMTLDKSNDLSLTANTTSDKTNDEGLTAKLAAIPTMLAETVKDGFYAITGGNTETITADNETGEITYTITNKPKPAEVSFIKYGLKKKTDEAGDSNTNGESNTTYDKEVLSGVEFKLQKQEGKYWRDIGTATSDKNGKISFNNLESGEYRILEPNAPEGFRQPGENEAVKSFTVKGGKAYVKDSEGNLQEVSEGNNNNEIHNTPKGDRNFELTKTDDRGNKLEGVEFELWNSDRTQSLGKKKTDDEGKITFENLDYGTYWLKETETLPGYILDDNFVKIQITSEIYKLPTDEDGNVVQGKDVYDQLFIQGDKIVSTTGSESVVYPNDAEGLYANVVIRVAKQSDDQTSIKPGDTFKLKFSDNLDLDGIGNAKVTSGYGVFDIVGKYGTIAKAEIIDKRTIKYTFTDYVKDNNLAEDIQVSIPVFINRDKVQYNVPSSSTPAQRFVVSLVEQNDSTGNTIKPFVFNNSYNMQVKYFDKYNYPTANFINAMPLMVNQDTKEFKMRVYINMDGQYTWNKWFTFKPSLGLNNLEIKAYNLGNQPQLPHSYGLDLTNKKPANIYKYTNVPAYSSVRFNIDNTDNYNSYVLEITGKIKSDKPKTMTTRSWFNEYRTDAYGYQYTHRDYYWDTDMNFYTPKLTSDTETKIVKAEVTNDKNKVVFTKIEAIKENLTKDGSTGGQSTGEQTTQKVNESNINYLKDAEFELRKFNENTKKYEKVIGKDIAKSDVNGRFSWTKIAPGKYEVWEIKAPKGYIKPYEAVATFEVDKNGHIIKQTTAVIENNKGEYPLTGGRGTLIFTLAGLVLMSAAAYVYSRKRGVSYDE